MVQARSLCGDDESRVHYDGADLHFLGTLTKPGQIAWFSEAMAVLNEVERRIEEWESSNLDIYSRMLAAHGRREVEMRRQWLEEARTRILEVRQERAG